MRLSPWPLGLALLAAASCKPRQRVDPRAVVPLVSPGRGGRDAGAGSAGADASARPRPQPRRAVRYITDRAAPDGALGVRWGMTREAVLALHQAASVTCRDSREYVFCTRALTPLPVPAVVTYEFCGAALCAVAVDAQRTRDEARMSADFDRLLETVRASLGPPSDEARRVGAGCAGHLALCLASRQAEMSARWLWRDGPQVQLSVDQDEGDAFQALAAVTWLSAERARRQAPADEPAAPSAPVDAGAADAR